MKHTKDSIKLLTNDPDFVKLLKEVMLDKECTLKIEKVKEIHPYIITPPNPDAKDKRWSTNVYDPTCKNNRKKKRGKTEEDLWANLYYHYFEDEISHTIESNFENWIQYRIDEESVKDPTVHRYRNYWNRYYKGTEIVKIPLHKITSKDIKNFFKSCFERYSITSHELSNMSIIIRDGLALAMESNLITSNPFYNVKIKRKSCSPPLYLTRKHERVFHPDEKEKFTEQLLYYIEKNPDDTRCYALAIMFDLALRVGELLALDWSKIDWKHSIIRIDCMFSKEDDENGKLKIFLEDHCKGGNEHSVRPLHLSENTIALFKKIKSINELKGYKHENFIFCDQDGLLNTGKLDKRCRYLCKKAGVLPARSVHDIRRTVASELYRDGVPLEMIRDFLGHKDVGVTLDYIYDFKKEEEKKQIMINAQTGLIGLKID